MYVLIIIIYSSLIKIVQAFDSFNMGPRYYRSTGHLSSHRCPQECQRRGVVCGPALHRVHRSQTAKTRVCQPCIDLWLAELPSLHSPFPVSPLSPPPPPPPTVLLRPLQTTFKHQGRLLVCCVFRGKSEEQSIDTELLRPDGTGGG